MSLPKYAEYKDSGVAWLGEVPAHWQVTPVKRVANIVNGYPFDSNLFDSSIGMPLVRIRDLNKKTTEALYKGERIEAAVITSADMLVGMDGDFNVGRWLGDGAALLNQRMCCVRGRSEQVSRLLEYALPTPLRLINDLTYSTTVKHLASSQIEKTRVALPQGERELESILAFLDRETSKIDALIAEQEKLLTLLAEKRQATISHAVTRGLNPNAPMKDCGVPWLGEVPMHWEVSPLKYVSHIGNGSTPNRDNPDYWAEAGFPWLNSSVVNQDEVTEAERFVTGLALTECHLPVIEPPAILVGITGQGKTRGMAAPLIFKATINQHLAFIKPAQNRLLVTYLLRALEMSYEHLRTESEGAGSTKGAITCDQLSRFSIPLPPLDEQAAIARHLGVEAAKFDKLSDDAGRAIDLLKERRSALISAAVTGKIDAREAA